MHKRLTIATTALSLAAALPASLAQPSAPATAQAFEVATLRRSQPGNEAREDITPDGYRTRNFSIARLVIRAYVPTAGVGARAPFYEITRVSGGPEWTREEEFDLTARIADFDRTEWQKPEPQKLMLQAMLQNLLAEKCKLAVHREMKELPTYALTIARSGPKLKQAETVDPAELRKKHPGGILLPGGGMVEQNGPISYYGTPISTLAEMLSLPAGRPVEDKTGLTASYDFTIKNRDPGDDPESPAQSIFTSLQDQLGLRLDPSKGQVEILVIDHIQRPVEN